MSRHLSVVAGQLALPIVVLVDNRNLVVGPKPALHALPIAPLTRGECAEWVLPCALTRCRHHLANPVHGRAPLAGRIGPVCALDAADAGEHTLDAIGGWMGVTDTTALSLERAAIQKLGSGKTRASSKLKEIHAHEWPVLESATEPEDGAGLSDMSDGRRGPRKRRRAADPADVRADSDEKMAKASEVAE